jgi:hypothetical protein
LEFSELTARKLVETGLTGINVKRELDSLRDLLVDPVALAAVKIDFQV